MLLQTHSQEVSLHHGKELTVSSVVSDVMLQSTGSTMLLVT